MKLYLIRGIPGSGKTSLATTLMTLHNYEAIHCEADKYFYYSGEYVFNPTKLKQAHQHCQGMCEQGMKEGKVVIVSNTTTTEKEVSVYTELAKRYEYELISLVVENRHGSDSAHNVPQDVIDKMKKRFSVKL